MTDKPIRIPTSEYNQKYNEDALAQAKKCLEIEAKKYPDGKMNPPQPASSTSSIGYYVPREEIFGEDFAQKGICPRCKATEKGELFAGESPSRYGAEFHFCNSCGYYVTWLWDDRW